MDNLTPEELANLDHELFHDINNGERSMAYIFLAVKERLGITQDEMGDLAGITRTAVSRIENSVTTAPKNNTLYDLHINLARRYGVLLRYDKLLQAKRISSQNAYSSRPEILDELDEWYMNLSDEKKQDIAYLLAMLIRSVD